LAIKLGIWLYCSHKSEKPSNSAKIFGDFDINSFAAYPESKLVFQLETKAFFMTNYFQIFIIKGFYIELKLFEEQNRNLNNPSISQFLKKCPIVALKYTYLNKR
jgi:hypothetical protein